MEKKTKKKIEKQNKIRELEKIEGWKFKTCAICDQEFAFKVDGVKEYNIKKGICLKCYHKQEIEEQEVTEVKQLQAIKNNKDQKIRKSLFLIKNYVFQSLLRIKIFFSYRDIRSKKKPNLRHGGLGVVIGDKVKFGNNVTVCQNVTIGSKEGKQPVIEDNVFIYPHSIIFGGITIGKNSIIGSGTLINKDIPPNSIVYNKRELIIRKNYHKLLSCSGKLR